MTFSSQGRSVFLATAADILYWSDRVEARTEFPRLIRRLIRESNDQVVRIEMRAAEGAGVPGYDGVVEASQATPFVPAGISYWELGVSIDPQKKANSDYRKRSDELGNGNNSDATFVFVTSRRWAGKEKWEAGKRVEGRWRDVRALDVDDIEQALEAAPAVHVWLSEVVGKPVRGAQSLEDWWLQFARRTNPTLTSSLVLAGREDKAAELARLLTQDRSFTTISAASVDDDLAFIAATILASDIEQQSQLLGQTLVVRDKEFLRWLDGVSHLLILVPLESNLRREAESIRGHHIVFLGDEDTPADFEVPAIRPLSFAHDLAEMGVPEQEAERMAQAAERSLRRFQRIASPSGTVLVPEWTNQLGDRFVRRAWLAGGWNTGRSGDADVLAGLFGVSFAEAVDKLSQAGRGADPLFTHIGNAWAVGSPGDSWDYGHRRVNFSDLQAIETAIQSVLGAVDPALDLPILDRWKASVYGKERLHSSNLREGLATTLALFGSMGDALSLSAGTTGRSWAEGVVYRLLDRANGDSTGRLWVSLSDVMPWLAEAAPDVFLSSVQTGLAGENPLLQMLFLDKEDGFTINSPHTYLLWSMELVAWSSSRFGLTTDLLARLVEVDPGGRLSNRPAKSLADIFRPWLPQTSASVSSRLAALQVLVRRHPDVGWHLLLALLPNRQAVGMRTYGPRFRDWKPQIQGVSVTEFWEFSSSVAMQVLDIVKREPERWTEIASRLPDFPPPERALAYGELRALSEQALPIEIRTAIWGELDEELRHHREFPDATWVLPPAELDRLEIAIQGLKPQDIADRNRWLFEDFFPTIGSIKRDDHEEYEREVALLRGAAIQEILEEGGLVGLQRLVAQSSAPWLIGMTLATVEAGITPIEVVELLDSVDEKQASFAFAYVAKASQGRLGWLLPFAEAVTNRPLLQARLLRASDELEMAWEAAMRLGQQVDMFYWKEFRTSGLGGTMPLANRIACQLIDHGRPAAALDLLVSYRNQATGSVDPKIVVDGFEAVLAIEDDEIQLLSNYEIEELLEFLRRSKIDQDALASLEWRLLPALRFDARSPVLERQLARDPAFFVEIVSLSFKPRSGEHDHKSDSRVARNAYRLLHDWKLIPGSDELEGHIDEERLKAWASEARRLLVDADREVVGEQLIGAILAHGPLDADGTWPSLPVRNMIEESESAELENGFHVGTYNKRGVTSRGTDEGGEQEYRLAEQFDGWSETLADQWPRTAAILRSIGNGYRAEGRTHDEDARRHRAGL